MVTRRQRCRLELALAIEALPTESQAAQQVRVQSTPTKPTIRVRGRAPPRRLVLAQGSQLVRCHPLPLRTDASEVSQTNNVPKTLCCARQGNPWGAQSSKVNSTGLPTSATHTHRTSHFFRGAKEHDQLKNRTDTPHVYHLSSQGRRTSRARRRPCRPALGSSPSPPSPCPGGPAPPAAPSRAWPPFRPPSPRPPGARARATRPLGPSSAAPCGSLRALRRSAGAGVGVTTGFTDGRLQVSVGGGGGCVGGNGGRTGELGGRGRGRKEIAGTMEMSFVALSPLYFIPENGISVLRRYLVPGPGKIETIRSFTE